MALQIQELTISLHGQPLVQDLSATVQAGEVLAVMGPSGSGKSSLLAWLAGTLGAPFLATGRVQLNGRELSGLPIQTRRVGLLFQDDLLFVHMSVLDNLLFALPPGARSERLQQAEAALAEAGLAGFGARKPASLSGGQRSRVALLRALLASPDAMLLDEPFSKLDAALRVQMREFTFGLLRQRGVPTVLVTHDPADVPQQAHTVHLAVPPSPLTGGEGGDPQSEALRRRSGLTMLGQAFGRDGGEIAVHHPLTPTPALPRQGGGSNTRA